MIPPIEFETIKSILEDHLHFATIHCELDDSSSTANSYTIKLYRDHIVDPVFTILVDKCSGSLVWLITHKFGESDVTLYALLDAIRELKERRLCYVTRVNSRSDD